VVAGGVLDVVRLVEHHHHVLGVAAQPAEELRANPRVKQVVIVADREVHALDAVLQELVPAEAGLLGVLVDVLGRAHAVVEPLVEVVVVPDEVVVVALADVALAEVFEFVLHGFEFVEDGVAGLGGLAVALAALLQQGLLALLQLALVALGVHELVGVVAEDLALLVVHVDVAHRPLPLEDDRAQRRGVVNLAGLADELPHLLVDVRRDDDRLVRLAGVRERRRERGERLPGAAGALKEHVPAGVEGVPDAVHRLPLVVVRRRLREELHVLRVARGHVGVWFGATAYKRPAPSGSGRGGSGRAAATPEWFRYTKTYIRGWLSTG